MQTAERKNDEPIFAHPIVLRSLRPRPKVDTWEWICANGRTHTGERFDGDLVPWCRGVCQAFDDPRIREINLQWGTRLGKTLICQLLCISTMQNNPMPGLFGSAAEKLAARIVKNKFYPMIEATPELGQQLKPKAKRSVYWIDLHESHWGVAWSGSESMLADYSAWLAYANEVDKWDTALNKEGDPLEQFSERVKEFPDHKILYECTPTLEGTSRIARRFGWSNESRYYVPCVRCGHFQVLRLGTDDPASGGLLWDHTPDGHSDPELARRTARYICEACRGEIHDERRPHMMRGGQWVPAGCRINKRGRIAGEPLRDGPSWGGQLSSLYSLQLRWGDVAARFCRAKGNKRLLQVFVNLWLGETWSPHRKVTEPEELAERLVLPETSRGKVPEGFTWLAAAIDCQDTFFVYTVIAFAPNERWHLVDWGFADSWHELEDEVIGRAFARTGSGDSIHPSITLVDSGDGRKTREVYGFCRQVTRSGRDVLPCKGAATDLGGEPYQRTVIGDGTKAAKKSLRRRAIAARGLLLIRVNNFFWEPVIQAALDELAPSEAGALTFPPEAGRDQDLLRQILNGAQSHEPSKLNPDKLIWVKRWEDQPNDFRDCLKYARCGIELRLRGDWSRAERAQPKYDEVSASAQSTFQEEPDSRPRRRGRFRLSRRPRTRR